MQKISLHLRVNVLNGSSESGRVKLLCSHLPPFPQCISCLPFPCSPPALEHFLPASPHAPPQLFATPWFTWSTLQWWPVGQWGSQSCLMAHLWHLATTMCRALRIRLEYSRFRSYYHIFSCHTDLFHCIYMPHEAVIDYQSHPVSTRS